MRWTQRCGPTERTNFYKFGQRKNWELFHGAGPLTSLRDADTGRASPRASPRNTERCPAHPPALRSDSPSADALPLGTFDP
jgi:hypothetical protein